MQLDVHTVTAHPLDVVLNQQKMTFFCTGTTTATEKEKLSGQKQNRKQWKRYRDRARKDLTPYMPNQETTRNGSDKQIGQMV
jgi:hypothetical protein